MMMLLSAAHGQREPASVSSLLMMPLDVLAGCAPLRCSAALQAVSDSEQQRPRAVLADPPKDWLRPRFQEGLALLEEPLHHDWQHAAETLGTLQRAASIAGQGWQHPWRLLDALG